MNRSALEPAPRRASSPPKSVYPHLGLRTHLLGLARTLGDPGLCLVPSLVEGEKAGLAAPLDELIWFRDELGGEDPARELSVGGDGAGGGIPGDLGYLRSGVDEGGDDLCGGADWGCALEPVGKEQLGIVLADRCRSCSSRVPEVERREERARTFGRHGRGLLRCKKGGGESGGGRAVGRGKRREEEKRVFIVGGRLEWGQPRRKGCHPPKFARGPGCKMMV